PLRDREASWIDTRSARKLLVGVARCRAKSREPELAVGPPAELDDRTEPDGLVDPDRSLVERVDRAIAGTVITQIGVKAPPSERKRDPRPPELVEVVRRMLARVAVQLDPFVEREKGTVPEENNPFGPRNHGQEVVPRRRLVSGRVVDVVVVPERRYRYRRTHAERTPAQVASDVGRLEGTDLLSPQAAHGKGQEDREEKATTPHGAPSLDPDGRGTNSVVDLRSFGGRAADYDTL